MYLINVNGMTIGEIAAFQGLRDAGGRRNHKQPALITRELLYKNTNYIGLAISSTSTAENIDLRALVVAGRAQLISQTDISEKFVDAIGGTVSGSDRKCFASIPDDAGTEWGGR